MSPPRVMVYVQHLMGIGHQRRAAAIARALLDAGLEVGYVSGGYPVPHLDTGGARFVQLPPARSPDMRYQSLVDARGEPVDEAWRARRRAALRDAFEQLVPDALIVETFPFGRRLLRFELLPLLDAALARRPRPRVLCSVRDILEPRRQPGRNAEIVALARRYFDRVLVHSDPALVPFEASFPPAAELGPRLCYTGYVLDAPPAAGAGTAGAGEVVVSAGGGWFGEHVLRAALDARALSRRLDSATWRVLAGPHLEEARFAPLRAAAPAGVVVERNRPDFATLLRNCAVSVSQGGYNTVLEVLAAGARAVVVPYADAREREQDVRARLLSEKGLIRRLPNDALSPATLAAAVDAAHAAPPPARATAIDTGGAARTARIVRELLAAA